MNQYTSAKYSTGKDCYHVTISVLLDLASCHTVYRNYIVMLLSRICVPMGSRISNILCSISLISMHHFLQGQCKQSHLDIIHIVRTL
jgi:hypothetical protein